MDAKGGFHRFIFIGDIVMSAFFVSIKNNLSKEEIANTLTHAVGLFLSVIGFFFLCYKHMNITRM